MVTDSSTAMGITSDYIKQKCSKAMDMHFYWIRDRVRQGQFIIHWQRGATNQGDYWTKNHPVKHNVKMRPHVLHTDKSNRYAPLADNPPQTTGKPSPNAGEGVLIPNDARAHHLKAPVTSRRRTSIPPLEGNKPLQAGRPCQFKPEHTNNTNVATFI
jgi:hypothetical protein